ncbi:MAG: DUF1460 domain-containing protein [Bacteroidia bacterium]|nr:DUF1460 domain-containing protein [Bacteroidia bacterium]
MKIRLLLLFLCAFSINILIAAAAPKIIVTEKDKSILQEKFDKFSKDSNLSVGELILKIGNDFKGTPYVGKTLDLNIEENLVVNLRELDCTTFVENCLAIARTIKKGNPTFESFTNELEKIRYRNGQLNGYVSRLHYFGEWITNNSGKGIVEDMSSKIGGEKCPVVLNFMSTHPDSYPQLMANPALIKEIKQIEIQVSAKQFFFIPKEKIASCESQILNGDLVAFVTKIPGMDVSHVGILFKKDGRVFLLHAPLSGEKVMTTTVPLADYLKDSKNTTGIFVVRAK